LRARLFLEARRRRLRFFGLDTERLAERDTLALALVDFAVAAAFGVAARRLRRALRFVDLLRLLLLVALLFFDRDTLALVDLAEDAAFGVAARRLRRALRFVDLLRRLLREALLLELDTLALGAGDGAFGVAARRLRRALRFVDPLRDRETLGAVEAAFGVAARRLRRALRFVDLLRLLLLEALLRFLREADRLRARERREEDRDRDGDLAFLEPVRAVDGASEETAVIAAEDGARGTDALRRRRLEDVEARLRRWRRAVVERLRERLRDVDGAFGVADRWRRRRLLRRLSCFGFFTLRAFEEAARFFAFRSA